MSTLNTKGMTYNVLQQEYILFQDPHIATVYIFAGVFLFFFALIPCMQEITPIKSLKDLIQKPLITAIIIPTLYFVFGILVKITPHLYLWTHQQNSEHFTVSKSEILANILSNDCHFAGYVYRPINNENIHKTCIKVPLTDKEYEKIIAYLDDGKKHEEKCMNPDVTIKE